MSEILHLLEIEASPERVYEAIATPAGLGAWWTSDVRGGAPTTPVEVGQEFELLFGGDHGPRLKALQAKPGRGVEWECVGGHAEWIGTRLLFHLTSHGPGTVLRFAHRGWREPSDYFAQSNCRWGFFLHSLKGFVEAGAGRPWPNDRLT
jgi:uncharacterized protein YndB with AHSA1/START domain